MAPTRPDRPHPGLESLLLALLPWLAFEVTLATSVVWAAEQENLDLTGLVVSAPLYIGFVALPSWLPIRASKGGWVRWSTTAVMTLVSIAAAVAIVMTDDAQAGLAVLLVPYVAIPLAILILGGQLLVDRLTSRPG